MSAVGARLLAVLLVVAVAIAMIPTTPQSVPAHVRMRRAALQQQRQSEVVDSGAADDADTDAADDTADEDDVETDVSDDVEADADANADAGVDPQQEAAVSDALDRSMEGLQAWWGPSAETVAKLNAGGPQAWQEAQNRLFFFGEDVNDLDSARFASARVSAGLAARVSARLQFQSEQRAAAAARRRAALHSSVSLAGATAVCTGVVAAVRAYHVANGAYPANAGLIQAAVLAAVVNSEAAEIVAMFPVVMYRASALNGWGAVCGNRNELEVDLAAAAHMAAPVGGAVASFNMGLEEEVRYMRINPDNHNKNHFIRSGNVPAPRVAPYVKLAPDHTGVVPPGWPGGSYCIVEVVTGPMDITWANRNTHRAVVDRFTDAAPGPWPWQYEGAQRTFTQLANTFNTGIAGAGLGNYAFDLTTLRPALLANAAAFHVTKYPNPNSAHNSVQVNFEVGLCALFRGNNFHILNVEQSQRDLWTAARGTANAFVSAGGGMAGVRAQAIAGLPAQQLCELKGLFTIVTLRALYWGAWVGAAAKCGTDADNYPNCPIHPEGGTPKNFYGIMPKTTITSIVDHLPFPLSDVVHSFYRAYMAGQVAVENALYAALHAQLQAVHSPYAANVVDFTTHPATVLGAPNVAWLDNSGDFFRGPLEYLGGSIAAHPAYAPAGNDGFVDGAPPAGIYREPVTNNQQVIIVCEARYQTEELQRAITREMAPVPAAVAAAMTAVQYSTGLIDQLRVSVTSFAAGAANPPAMPGP